MRIAQLASLAELNLEGCNLVSLPEELYQCTQLEVIMVSGNTIAFLSPQIGRLCHLSTLVVARCGLAELPDVLFDECAAIQHLSAGENNFAKYSLSPKIAKLTDLRALDLSETCLAGLPNELFACTKLERLNVGGNISLSTLHVDVSKVSLFYLPLHFKRILLTI